MESAGNSDDEGSRLGGSDPSEPFAQDDDLELYDEELVFPEGSALASLSLLHVHAEEESLPPKEKEELVYGSEPELKKHKPFLSAFDQLMAVKPVGKPAAKQLPLSVAKSPPSKKAKKATKVEKPKGKMGAKSRNFAITIHAVDSMFTEEQLASCLNWMGPFPILFEDLPSCVSYFIYQRERCPESGRHHLQCYMECVGQQTYARIQSIPGFAGCHIEPRRGSQEDNIKYCSKEDSRVEGPFVFGVPKAQGMFHYFFFDVRGGRSVAIHRLRPIPPPYAYSIVIPDILI